MQALQRSHNNSQESARRITLHPQSQLARGPSFEKIVFKVASGAEFIDPRQVSYLRAHSNYCEIVLQDRSVVVSKTLKQCSSLFPQGFLRVHQSYFVNTTCLRSYDSKKSLLTTDSGASIPVSRSCRTVVRTFIENNLAHQS